MIQLQLGPGAPRRAALAVGLLVAGACGGGETASGARGEPSGAQLVAGSSLDRWGALVIPREGGVATFRSLRDLTRETWAGGTRLPASVSAHALEDGLVVLRDAEGAVYRYDPAADEAERVGRISPQARWAAAGRAGLLLDPEGREVLSLSRSGAWRYAIPHPVEWAAPLEPGAAALLVRSPSGPQVWVLREGEERPAATLEAEITPPGLVTAWGRRLLFATPTERSELQVLTLAPLAPAGRLDAGGAPLAVAVSPSTHEVYAALDDPPRVVAVNRFSGQRREVARLPRPAAELRVSPFGDPILARDGSDGVWRLPVRGGEAERLDAAWRTDLPVALPGGRVLLARGDEVRLAGPGGATDAGTLPGSAGDWWLVVRWSPAPPPVVAGEVAVAPLTDPARESAGARPAETPAPTGGEAPPTAAAGAEGVTPAGAAGETEGETTEADPPPPPGFYAIVASARGPEGVRGLTQGLAAAGYPTRVQRVPDDAGRTWHRGLVGPYRSRGEAEAAARQLERERQLSAWVTELGPGSEGRGALP